MKTHRRGFCCALAFLLLAVSSLHVFADAKVLLRLGENSYVIEAGSETPDRRFAVAWSLFPKKPTTPAFDWSKWNPETPYAFFDDPNVVDGEEGKPTGKYVAKSVLLDLERKEATLLDLDLCYISRRMEVSSSMSWDISWVFNGGDKRVALIRLDGRRGILNLFVLMVDGSNVTQLPALDQLWEFARADLKRNKVKNQSAFEYMQVEAKGNASQSEFPVRYSVSPRSMDPSYERDVNLILRNGKITVQAGSGKASAPSQNQNSGPLRSLAEADARLNVLYKGLQSTLSSEKMASLRVEQRQWLKDRELAVKAALSKAGLSEAGREGKSLADQIMLNWTVQRCAELENLSK